METEKKTFQQSITRLEAIVEKLNDPNLELEEAMSLFKEGLALSRSCQGQLDAFEKEMNELITDTGTGNE